MRSFKTSYLIGPYFVFGDNDFFLKTKYGPIRYLVLQLLISASLLKMQKPREFFLHL